MKTHDKFTNDIILIGTIIIPFTTVTYIFMRATPKSTNVALDVLSLYTNTDHEMYISWRSLLRAMVITPTIAVAPALGKTATWSDSHRSINILSHEQ